MSMLMKHLKTLLMVAMFGVGTIGLAGCEDDGGFEDAGEEIDQAGDELEDTGENIGDEFE